ncbi:hypothetical protein AKJ16_DCAP00050 [Drosera capensis]
MLSGDMWSHRISFGCLALFLFLFLISDALRSYHLGMIGSVKFISPFEKNLVVTEINYWKLAELKSSACQRTASTIQNSSISSVASATTSNNILATLLDMTSILPLFLLEISNF